MDNVKIVILYILIVFFADTSSTKPSATAAGQAEASTSRPTLPSAAFMQTTCQESPTTGNKIKLHKLYFV